MKRFGLIGKNISYSFSENYFDQKFETEKIENCNYSIFDLNEISDVKKLFEIPELKGLNVTIPYKEKIIPFLDELSVEAKTVGAVNCIGIVNGIKTGYNTDVFGFENSIKNFLDNFDLKALILGDGGAAKAVKYVLKQLNISFKTVSRKGEFNYSDLNESEIKAAAGIMVMVLSQFCTLTVVKVISITSPSALYFGISIQSPTRTISLADNWIPATNPRIEFWNTSSRTADSAPKPPRSMNGF